MCANHEPNNKPFAVEPKMHATAGKRRWLDMN